MINVQSRNLFQSIDQFIFINKKSLGTGSFGVVKLAIHKSTNQAYAIKIIDLKQIPTEIELKMVQRQVNIHMIMDHPNIIKLWDIIIEDDQKLYLILEYAEHGNIFYFQNDRTRLMEPQAYRLFSQAVNGVQRMHQLDIIHRDLKPENLLLDHNYNLKICDLGWAAQGVYMKRTTFCGTYQYMAPEMLLEKSYDYRIDIWALGVFLYELLHGHAPFRGQTVQQVKKSLSKGTYELDFRLSKPIQQLIISILQFDPNDRPSFQAICSHKWMRYMESLINNYIIDQCQAIFSKKFSPKYFHLKICQIPRDYYLKKFAQLQEKSKANISYGSLLKNKNTDSQILNKFEVNKIESDPINMNESQTPALKQKYNKRRFQSTQNILKEHRNKNSSHKKSSSAQCKDNRNININFSINNYEIPKMNKQINQQKSVLKKSKYNRTLKINKSILRNAKDIDKRCQTQVQESNSQGFINSSTIDYTEKSANLLNSLKTEQKVKNKISRHSRNKRSNLNILKTFQPINSSLVHEQRKSQNKRIQKISSMKRINTQVVQIGQLGKNKKEDITKFSKKAKLEKMTSHKNFSSMCLQGYGNSEINQRKHIRKRTQKQKFLKTRQFQRSNIDIVEKN